MLELHPSMLVSTEACPVREGLRQGLNLLHLSQRFDPIHAAGHLDVQNHDVEELLLHDLERFLPAPGTRGVDVALLKTIDQGFQKSGSSSTTKALK